MQIYDLLKFSEIFRYFDIEAPDCDRPALGTLIYKKGVIPRALVNYTPIRRSMEYLGYDTWYTINSMW